MLQYARPQFKKRHQLDTLTRIHNEPRWLKQKARVESTARKNYFYGKQETNDMMNEINRMEGIIGDMVRPVGGHYLEELNARKNDTRKNCMLQTNRHHRVCTNSNYN